MTEITFFSIVVVARHSFVNVHLMIIMMGIANKNNEFDDRTDRPLTSLLLLVGYQYT